MFIALANIPLLLALCEFLLTPVLLYDLVLRCLPVEDAYARFAPKDETILIALNVRSCSLTISVGVEMLDVQIVGSSPSSNVVGKHLVRGRTLVEVNDVDFGLDNIYEA